eukprot:CAMPEP_0180280052 /NCGR_PEP_ID=MMETSP0988-20121125/8419_1 /TAXON_ID=697907 /ORGANISM="non described non described, Strain CCMP2293" /LENGTH=119 /DNA_ID=CAMNT_0022251857 /DNA_START=320 /DNA_END=676 /DNA_ORIENTATION=+
MGPPQEEGRARLGMETAPQLGPPQGPSHAPTVGEACIPLPARGRARLGTRGGQARLGSRGGLRDHAPTEAVGTGPPRDGSAGYESRTEDDYWATRPTRKSTGPRARRGSLLGHAPDEEV